MSAAAEAHTPASLLARIRQDGVRRTAQALRKPPLPSALLQALADLPHEDAPEARLFVAAYPLAPSHLLETLAESAPSIELLALLATNPRTPPHLLIQFATHPESSIRIQAALHPQLPPRELLALADDPDASVRRALATNSSLRLPQQALISADAEPSVRLALAGQSALATPAALVLAIDDSALVRLQAVSTAPAEEETVLGWAATDEEEVQLALLRRRRLSEAAERLLFQSSHSSVRRAVRDRLELDPTDLLHLATVGDAEERRWLSARPTLPRPLQRLLAQDADATVRAALAANPRIDPGIADYFVDLADEPACLALSGNPSVSEELIQGVAATRRPAVLAALAYRETLEPALAALLVARSPVFRRHWAMQDRPLSGLEAEPAKLLSTDRLPSVRALAVRGHAWRRADLYDFLRDPVPRVRLAAVRHPNAPEGLITDALNDADPEVAEAARAIQLARTRPTPPAANIHPGTLPPSNRKPEPDEASEPFFTETPSSSRRDAGLLGKLSRLFR